jgi:hypothetical protein
MPENSICSGGLIFSIGFEDFLSICPNERIVLVSVEAGVAGV